MKKVFHAVLLLCFFLFPAAADQTDSPVYLNRIPPKLQAADSASRAHLARAAAAAGRFRRAAFVYTLRKASFILGDDLSCSVSLTDEIYVRHSSFTLNITTSKQLDRAKVILSDGRWFETVPRTLPAIPPGSLLILSGSFTTGVPKYLPLQQVVYPMQKPAPTARFEIEFSSRFRHKFYHAPEPLLRSRREENGKIIYSWEGTVPARIPCPNEAYPRSSGMRLVLTTLSSWDELREWALKTMRPEEQLDPAGQQLLHRLTDGVSDKTEQVKRIYNYLNRLRYLTVPVGEAKFRPQQICGMIRNGYGDCKDKSNALYVFCRELGIPAERVLVLSSGRPDVSFPSWQFNHMIVRIPELPGYPNGLWLDAAGGEAPFGELPAGTLDTEGLVLTGESTVFRKVEAPDGEKVHSKIREEMRIDPSGNVFLQVQLTGWFAADFRRFIKRSGSLLKNEAESLLDTLVPGADMKFFRFHARTSSYEFRAHLPLPGILPQMTLGKEVVRPFIPSWIPRPVRLFDGHQITFSRHVVAEGRSFGKISWEIRRERYFAELKVDGNQIDYAFGINRIGDNQLAPLHYQEIRSALNQLRLRLNSIREENR